MAGGKKESKGPRGKGCLMSVLAVLGFIVVCYIFCFVLYFINTQFTTPSTNTGGMLLTLLPAIF